MKLVVTLDTKDTRSARYFRAVKGVEVEEGADKRGTRLAIDHLDWPLHILPRPQSGIDVDDSARSLAGLVRVNELGMVVAGQIPEREREALEAAGLSWCDGRGAIHVGEGPVYVHIDLAARRQANDDDARLGLAGIRAVQVLLADPRGEWTLTRLQGEAGISIGQAHNVFKTLEQQRLVETVGRGPLQRRVLTDYRAALDWLATVDRRRRRPSVRSGFLYGRTSRDRLQGFAERAERHRIAYAFTAAAGAELLQAPVISRLDTMQVRVSFLSPEDAIDLLGLERVNGASGANIDVWADTGELGTFQARDIEGIKVAPPIRVWLDLARQGGRNDDAAQLFREQTLERI